MDNETHISLSARIKELKKALHLEFFAFDLNAVELELPDRVYVDTSSANNRNLWSQLSFTIFLVEAIIAQSLLHWRKKKVSTCHQVHHGGQNPCYV